MKRLQNNYVGFPTSLFCLLPTFLFYPLQSHNLPSLILKILDFIACETSRANSLILFPSQRLDLLSLFYVYLLDFDLARNLIHHLALYQVSIRTLKGIAIPLPSLLALWYRLVVHYTWR